MSIHGLGSFGYAGFRIRETLPVTHCVSGRFDSKMVAKELFGLRLTLNGCISPAIPSSDPKLSMMQKKMKRLHQFVVGALDYVCISSCCTMLIPWWQDRPTFHQNIGRLQNPRFNISNSSVPSGDVQCLAKCPEHVHAPSSLTKQYSNSPGLRAKDVYRACSG